MRSLFVLFALLSAVILASPARADDGDDSLRVYAVRINRTPKEAWNGMGIYIGRGLVLTAAHVAGLGFWRNPRVEIEGKELPTKIVKDGHFHDIDLTLLSVDESLVPVSLGLRRMPLCKNSPWAGEPVIVADTAGVARSRVMSPHLLPRGMAAKFHSVIRYVPETGNSGSGVFDATKKCLLGIISGKIFQNPAGRGSGLAYKPSRDIAKYFVPAPAIADFIPADLHP